MVEVELELRSSSEECLHYDIHCPIYSFIDSFIHPLKNLSASYVPSGILGLGKSPQ